MQFVGVATGLVMMLFIDTVGAIASRKLNFNYGWLSLISLINYLLIGYLQAHNGFGGTAMFSAAFVGLLDATLGLYLCLKLKANTGKVEVKWEPEKSVGVTIFFTVFAGFVGWLGSLLA